MSLNQNCEMEQIGDENQNPSFPETDCSNSNFILIRRATPMKQDIKDVVKFNILPQLPAKALIRFRAVSKDWDWWITSPLFAFHQSYSFRNLSGFFCQFDKGGCVFLSLDRLAYGVPTPPLRILPENATITSSSGGLLLCQGQNSMNTYYICNPVTQDWKELPEPEMYHGESASVLAFEPSARNMHSHYEVISAVRLFDQTVVGFEVYSSATKSWRQSIAVCVEFGYSDFIGTGFYMNGIAYWMLSTRRVLAYDVEDERYEIIPLLSGCPDDGVLTQLHGELCYFGILKLSGNEYLIKIYGGIFLKLKHTIEVHLDSEYTDEILEYRGLPTDEILEYRVLPCFREGEVMILVGSLIYWCSLSDGRTELISREVAGSFWNSGAVSYLPYVNSIVRVT